MKKLSLLLKKLENTISLFDTTNQHVSESSVGWHIEHSCKVIISISNVLQKSNPEDYQWHFNKSRSLVYIFGVIPRGRGKAPKAVMPDDTISKDSLQKSIALVYEKIAEWNNLSRNSYFEHPYFGKLNKKNTQHFLVIHTKHHLKIINDICNKH